MIFSNMESTKKTRSRPSGKSSALLAAVDFELLRSALFLNGRDDWPQAMDQCRI